MLTKISKTVSSLSKGVVTDYALYILISVCFYLSIFIFDSIFFDLVYSIILSCLIVLIGISIYLVLNLPSLFEIRIEKLLK